MARGDLAAACPRFAESYRLDPTPGTLLNVAMCEAKEGKVATSFAHVTEALEGMPNDDFRIAYAREQLALLEPRVPSITVTLANDSAGAHVIRDDVELRDGSFGVPLPLDPGPHVLVVRADGRADARQEVTLREGERLSLVLHAGSPVRVTREVDSGGRKRVLAIGAFAVGGVGIVTGIVTGVLFANAASTYSERCDARGCDEEGLSAASRAKTLDVVSPIAFGVGAIGIGAGTYLFLTSKRDTPRRTGTVDVRPQVSPALTGLSLTGAF
ncbi:MAG TPA: hypothetical protein VM925_31840 [Labilithrix sp.]|nr:hypothetical protein [Labilithrix sp.]